MSILTPFLTLPPLLAVIIIALVAALFMNIIYKYATNQKLMKELKDEINRLQKEAKGQSPEKAMTLQKKSLEVNMTYFKHSLKPTIYTMLPLLFVFLWVGSHYSYTPLYPDKEFTTTVVLENGAEGEIEILAQPGIEIIGEWKKTINNENATFTLKGKEGEYLIEYVFNGKKYNKEVLITKEQSYAKQSEKLSGNAVKEIRINYEKNELLDIFGWKLGWLGTYLIFSLLFSLATRKMMNLY